MTEEEAKQLRQEHARLREAYAQFKQESEQKDRRIEELEGLLMSTQLAHRGTGKATGQRQP